MNTPEESPVVERRTSDALTWRAAVVGALIVQSIFFGVFAWKARGAWIYADNFFYEVPAWNLASGHGFSMPTDRFDDPDLTALYRRAHPEAAGSTFIPSATFPPGYGFFLAAVYRAAGRSQVAALTANWALLGVTVLATAALARRAFGTSRAAYAALALAASYPLWAFWAARIMSDTLHVALVAVFAAVWLVESPSTRRTVVAGLFLGLASLTRPYATLLPLAFAVSYAVTRTPAFAPRRVALLAVVTWSLMGTWTVRNAYDFHRFMPATSIGRGSAVWISTFEAYHTPAERLAELRAIGQTDDEIYRMRGDAPFWAAATANIRANPGGYARRLVARVVRKWLHGDGNGTLPRPVANGLMAYGVGLFVLMLAGIWAARGSRDPVLAGSVAVVLYYSLAFLPMHVEARYMIPARPFGLLLSAPVVGYVLDRFFKKRGSLRVEPAFIPRMHGTASPTEHKSPSAETADLV